MREVLTNKYLWGPLLIAFLTQFIKFLIFLIKNRQINFKKLVDMGGFPSSHSASVSALSIMVGLSEGFNSVLFGVVAFFSLIIMYDAAGVRKAAGEQAKILNIILDELFQGHPISKVKLKELIGHTPFEVLSGAILGGFLGWLLWKI